jgi:outer membrane protein TolC
VAQLDVEVGAEQVREARGQLFPQVSLQSNVQVAPRGFRYNVAANVAAGAERLQLALSETLYAGGQIRAGIASAESRVLSARARYRIAEKDLDLQVRTRFSEYLKTRDELGFRGEGIERLRTYLTGIHARQAAGLSMEADVLRTQARLADEAANLEDARRRLDQARLELNDLMGRDPDAPLELAPVPPPAPPEPRKPDAWNRAPELEQARWDVAAAEAAINTALAGRLPRVDLSADAGLLGPGYEGLPQLGLSRRLRQDLGTSLTLNFSWPLLDFGIYRGRVSQARLLAAQARRRQEVAARDVRRQWSMALAEMAARYREIELRGRAVPIARDSWLAAESLYRGGSGTTLEVLDAYSTFITASELYAEAVMSYRVAEATALRWGTP